jgi:hypothetical protein
MKKKLLSIAAACVLGVQAIAMPMIANAEQGTHYVEKSDFNDVSIGGAKAIMVLESLWTVLHGFQRVVRAFVIRHSIMMIKET